MSRSESIPAVHRLLDPVMDCLTPDGIRQLAALRAEPSMQARIDYLADRCGEGQLTDEERSEYEAAVHLINFISLLQAKARRILTRESQMDGIAHK